jgi:2,4-didehydro-3-deoxy-L-rhamnonate hydrolase
VRLANLDGRMVALVEGGAIDLDKISAGPFGGDVFLALEQWAQLASLVAASDVAPTPFDDRRLRAPVPQPRQVFAIGLNYEDHAAESGVKVPDEPAVFTKFPTCITGPAATVALPSAGVDYEVELVVVIGQRAERVAIEQAWDVVAGFMVGQDLSERSVQLAGPLPQFSFGKSYAGFGPTGPAIVGLEEFQDRDSLAISCAIGDEVMQHGNTTDLIFNVPELIVRLSAVCALQPGDLIFTGTPDGVGMGRRPPRYLAPGDELISSVEGIGEIRTVFTAGPTFPGP